MFELLIKTMQKTFRELIQIYPLVYLDLSFQRKGGYHLGSGWEEPNFGRYIASTMRGSYCNSITLVCVRSCLEHLVSLPNAMSFQRDIKYYEDLLEKGYQYISVDGNNSSSAIYEFSKGTFAYFDNGNEYFFGDLTRSIQEKWLDNIITVNIIEQSTLDGACELFRNMNSNTKLNGQERRQARVSNLSALIRELGAKVHQVYEKLLGLSLLKIDQRSAEEHIAKIALHCENKSERLVSQELDNFYEKTTELSKQTTKRLEDNFEQLKLIAEAVDPLAKKHAINKGDLFALFFLIDFLFTKKLVVKKYKEFFNEFLKYVKQLKLESQNIPMAEQQELSYEFWSRHYDTSPSIGKILSKTEAWLAENLDSFKKQDIICDLVKRDSKNTFTPKQKEEAVLLQNEKDRNGNSVTMLDVATKKTHADHVKSVKDGGKTDMSNIEIMLSEDNLKKGSLSNEPYFPHQKQQQEEQLDLFANKKAV